MTEGGKVEGASLAPFRRSAILSFATFAIEAPAEAAQFRTTSAFRIPNSELIPNSEFRIPHCRCQFVVAGPSVGSCSFGSMRRRSFIISSHVTVRFS
jgi:hypothetical protein